MKPDLRPVPSELPDPPYPGDTKANGYKPEFDIRRIKQSRTWKLADSKIKNILLRLWLESWEEIPCGTFEDDDELIASTIDVDLEMFQGYRRQIMRGWTRHSDGRLYHPYITEMVLEMLRKRRKNKEKVSAWRAKKALAEADCNQLPTSNQPVGNPPEQEQEQEQEKKREGTKKSAKRFVKPALADVQSFCRDQRLTNVDPVVFFDHYETNGWKVGKNGMKDWKAALRNWNRREPNANTKPNPPQRPKRQVW